MHKQEQVTYGKYAVPLLELQQNRETMTRWAISKGEEGLVAYRSAKNTKSLDGLPTPLAQQYAEE